jgi:hypothetical protein
MNVMFVPYVSTTEIFKEYYHLLQVLRSSQISNSSQPSEDDPTKESGKKDEITKFFLGLVADYPMLYDTANYHYSDRRRRLISWKK